MVAAAPAGFFFKVDKIAFVKFLFCHAGASVIIAEERAMSAPITPISEKVILGSFPGRIFAPVFLIPSIKVSAWNSFPPGIIPWNTSPIAEPNPGAPSWFAFILRWLISSLIGSSIIRWSWFTAAKAPGFAVKFCPAICPAIFSTASASFWLRGLNVSPLVNVTPLTVSGTWIANWSLIPKPLKSTCTETLAIILLLTPHLVL